MGLFSKLTSSGLMNEIRCDEPSYLIWKWRPAGGNSKRENAIRWGSALRVKDGEVAVFVYNHGDGTLQDFIEGPFDGIADTKNLPILANLIGLAYDGGTPFQAEIYFINLAGIIQTRFAVPYFEVADPRFPDFSIPVAVRGTIGFKIKGYRQFIKLHRLAEFTLEDFQKQIRDAVSRYTKDIVANLPTAENIPVVQLDRKTGLISEKLEAVVSERLNDNFGVLVSGVDVGAVEIDKDSDGYRELVKVTKNATTARVEAETEDYKERLRIALEEGQYAQRKQTESAHFAAYQVEAQRDVGVAGANALGQFGAKAGSSMSDFNPAAMMAGMTLGGAIGQNLAGAMNGVSGAPILPPIPESKYYVAINGQPTGPYTVALLREMVQNGQLTRLSLVWKDGMAGWSAVENVDDLKSILGAVIPPIPTV